MESTKGSSVSKEKPPQCSFCFMVFCTGSFNRENVGVLELKLEGILLLTS